MLGMNIITSNITPLHGYGRCEQIFTLFFVPYQKWTQNTSRSAPEATLVRIPVIIRLIYTPRPAPGRRDAHH